jgi:SAM-dependent methyltransferase
MASPHVNDPSSYYSCDRGQNLAWELTICQCLSHPQSPYLKALQEPRTFGRVLGQYLGTEVDLGPEPSVLEIGGGEGTLMAELLRTMPAGEVTMVDLSPYFLERQRAALSGNPRCSFVRADALEFLEGAGRRWDLVISNENLGDLKTYVNLSTARVRDRVARAGGVRPRGGLAPIQRTAEKVVRYGLPLPEADSFSFNIGAIELVERLARRADAVFLSEHGADTQVPSPYREFLSAEGSTGVPRRIRLHGHDEYSVHFGHLERVAQELGFRTSRLHMLEFLGVRHDAGARFVARFENTRSESAQILHEFLHHVVEYQCLLLVRDGSARAADAFGGRGWNSSSIR